MTRDRTPDDLLRDIELLEMTAIAFRAAIAEIKRLTALMNEYAAQVNEGPLSCRHCGDCRDSARHRPLQECRLVLDGGECREPNDHHEFEGKEPL